MSTTTPKVPGEVNDPTGVGNDDFDQGLKESKFGYPVVESSSLRQRYEAEGEGDPHQKRQKPRHGNSLLDRARQKRMDVLSLYTLSCPGDAAPHRARRLYSME